MTWIITVCQKVIRSDCSLLRQGLRIQPQLCVISGFRHEVAKNCAILGYYAASSGNFFTDISGQIIDPILRVKNPNESLHRLYYSRKRALLSPSCCLR